VLRREINANLMFLTGTFGFGINFGIDFDEIWKTEILFFWIYRNFESMKFCVLRKSMLGDFVKNSK